MVIILVCDMSLGHVLQDFFHNVIRGDNQRNEERVLLFLYGTHQLDLTYLKNIMQLFQRYWSYGIHKNLNRGERGKEL